MAACDLLHLQPARLRAGCGRGARGGTEPAPARATATGGHGDRRRAPREPRHRGVRPQPNRVPGAPARGGAPPRGHPPRAEAPHRGAFRARPVPGGVRHGDDVARHPHASAQRGAPVAHQAHGPGLSHAVAQRAHPDGGAGGATRDRRRGPVRHRARRARHRGRHPPRHRRRARAHREPFQAGLRVGGVASRLGRSPGDAPPADRVVVRPVSESPADPRARSGGHRAFLRGRRGRRVPCPLRRVRPYRAVPARAPGSGSPATGQRARRAPWRAQPGGGSRDGWRSCAAGPLRAWP